jgi:indole-3-glycerol phosphate synthase
MSTILKAIVANKKVEVEQRKKQFPLNIILNKKRERKRFSLKKNLLQQNASGIIAEFKRKSPSKNWINRYADITEVVKGYENSNASAVSILTDFDFFGGNLTDLAKIGSNTNLPILRKDFIIDEYQIAEADRYGADIILLIAACLTPAEVKHLASTAKQFGLEVLLEIHNKQELKHICDDITFVGVNNRNLHNFTTNINTSLELGKLIPDNFIKISESGINSVEDINLLKNAGYKGFLIGETFMKSNDPVKTCYNFIESIQ